MNGVGGGGVHWNAETWRFLPSDFVLEDPSDATLWRELSARRHDDSGLGRHLRRARAALRPIRISVRHVGDRRQSARARSSKAAIRSKGRARGPIPIRRRRSRSATRCSPRRRANSATSRFRSRPAICRRPIRTRSASGSDPAPIAASANGSAAATIRRRARRRRFCRCCCANPNFIGARQLRGDAHQCRRSGKRATGVTFVDTRARNGSSRPISSSCPLSPSSTFSFCCSRASASPTIPSPITGVIGRNFTHQTISDVTASSTSTKFNFNPFIASGAIGMCIDEFNGDNFDHGPHRLRRRRLYGAGADQRAPDRDHAGSARHAALGRAMEEGGPRQLSQHGEAGHRRARQLLQLSRRLSRSRPDSTRTASAGRWCG